MCLHTLVKTGQGKQQSSDDDKYCALDQVESLFKHLLDFFYTNQITVCFASIKSSAGCLAIRPSLSNVFKSPIQIYAFTMLRSVGYSAEQKLSQHNSICEVLRRLAHDDDDKFYRLCLYLFRRFTEYHFLHVSHGEKAKRLHSCFFEHLSLNVNCKMRTENIKIKWNNAKY